MGELLDECCRISGIQLGDSTRGFHSGLGDSMRLFPLGSSFCIYGVRLTNALPALPSSEAVPSKPDGSALYLALDGGRRGRLQGLPQMRRNGISLRHGDRIDDAMRLGVVVFLLPSCPSRCLISGALGAPGILFRAAPPAGRLRGSPGLLGACPLSQALVSARRAPEGRASSSAPRHRLGHSFPFCRIAATAAIAVAAVTNP